MAPDFQYFFTLSIQGNFSHSWQGAIIMGIPTALILSFLYHNIVKQPLIKSLPGFLSQRLSVHENFQWNSQFKNHIINILLSIIIGIVSHLFWDSFTHYSGWFVQHHAILQMNLIFAGYNIPLYKVLQHGGTIIGALVIIFFILSLNSGNTAYHLKISYWLITVAGGVLLLIIKYLFSSSPIFFAAYIVTFISGNMIALILQGFYHRLNTFKH